jgi:hypothetical protein
MGTLYKLATIDGWIDILGRDCRTKPVQGRLNFAGQDEGGQFLV